MRQVTFFESLNTWANSMFDEPLLVEIPLNFDKNAPLEISIRHNSLDINITLIIDNGEFDVAYQLPFSFDAEDVAIFLKIFARFLALLQKKYYEITGYIFVDKNLTNIYPTLQSDLNKTVRKYDIRYHVSLKDNKIHLYRSDKKFVGVVSHNPGIYTVEIVVNLIYNMILLDQV